MVAKSDVFSAVANQTDSSFSFTIPSVYAYANVQVRGSGIVKNNHDNTGPSSIFNGGHDSPAANISNLRVPGGYTISKQTAMVEKTGEKIAITAICYSSDF